MPNPTSKTSRTSRASAWRSGPARHRKSSSSSASRPKACRFPTFGRSGFRSATCRPRSPAATSMPMSGPSRAPVSALPTALAAWSNIPISTPIGSLNMILSASEKLIKTDPERLRLIIDMHKKATDYAMAHPDEMVEVAMQKLGQQRKSIEMAVPNVELTWKIDDEFIKRAKAYSELMLEKKQVRQAPDLSRGITDQFM